MMKTTYYPRFIGGFCLALVIACAPVLAQSKDDLKITLTAEKVTVQQDGKETLAAVTRAQPGEIIQYTAVYWNQSQGAIRNLAPTLPIPVGMEYVADSAQPVARQASLDGKVFESIPIQRSIKGPDGKKQMQPVPPAQYRALRWLVADLPAGKSLSVVARARIAGTGPVRLK